MAKLIASPSSALAIARSIDAGEQTPAHAVDAALAHIAERDEAIGAFVTVDPVAARRKAQAARGPLAGLALGIKDVYETADFPTEFGTPVYAGFQPRSDAALVTMAQAAGAVAVGKTVTTELQFLQPAGTRNPWHLDHTPGGSSSGSAAAVAAGMLPLALGSQTGGSVIRPAAYCGIAGYKPSFRLFPTVGLKCFSWSLDTVGFFAAGVADVAYCAEGLSGRPLRVDGRAPAAPRIGVVRTHLWHEAAPEMRQAIEATARAAERQGAVIVDIELGPLFAEAFAVHPVIQNYQAAQALGWERLTHRDRLSEILISVLDEGAATPHETYDRSRGIARRARLALKDLFSDVDVLLTPSAPDHAPYGLSSTGSPIFNRLWTLMGTPAVNVPGQMSASGLPLGVQVIAPFGRDARCLEAAYFVEQAIARGH